jgi:hypothetical protein
MEVRRSSICAEVMIDRSLSTTATNLVRCPLLRSSSLPIEDADVRVPLDEVKKCCLDLFIASTILLSSSAWTLESLVDVFKLKNATNTAGSRDWCFRSHICVSAPSGNSGESGESGDIGECRTRVGGTSEGELGAPGEGGFAFRGGNWYSLTQSAHYVPGSWTRQRKVGSYPSHKTDPKDWGLRPLCSPFPAPTPQSSGIIFLKIVGQTLSRVVGDRGKVAGYVESIVE